MNAHHEPKTGKCELCNKKIMFTHNCIPDNLNMCIECFSSLEGEKELINYKFTSSDEAIKVINFKNSQGKYNLSEAIISNLDKVIIFEMITEGKTIKPGDKWIEHFSQKVFNSKDFLNAFNDAVPRDDRDKDLGIENMPYLLSSLRKRKDDFENKSNKFLKLLSTAVICFIAFSTYFSMIMLGQVIVGDERILNDIKSNSDAIKLISQNEIRRFKAESQNKLNRITSQNENENENENENQVNILSELKESLSEINTADDIFEYKEVVTKLLRDNKSNPNNKPNELSKAKSEIISNADQILREINSKIQAENFFNKNMSILESYTEKNATAIVIRHFSIGLVTSVIFIYLIKILVSLYTHHIREKTTIENTDVGVRKFHIAYKSCQTQEQRQAVLTQFIQSSENNNKIEQDKDITQHADKTLPEFLNLLAEVAARRK